MLLDFFKKHDRAAAIQPSGEKLVVPAGQKLLNAALDAGLAWPHDCRVGSCGKCRCVLKEGKIKPLADFSYTLEHDDISAGAILA
ncbi:MAG: 2Fe-2S iron-sulfur cluster-binding protein, partial [Gammaproteobacteria bacterium]